MDVAAFILIAKSCAPSVNIQTARALVAVESNYNPYAIGVVGGELDRQPRSLAEALATAASLKRNGWDYSVGIAQINVRNFEKHGLDDRTAFNACANLKAMQSILGECFSRASRVTDKPQKALRFAFSCYYSGNFQTGFDHGYVTKVERAALTAKALSN